MDQKNSVSMSASIKNFALVLTPLALSVLSVVPTSYLRLVAFASEAWPFELPVGALLRALGAASLVLGHATGCKNKPKLSRPDKCYLLGVSLLTLFFAGVCASMQGLAPMPPPLVVSLAGVSLLGCFLDSARSAWQPGTAVVTRFAVTAALCGSTSLVVAGASDEYRAAASMLASTSFLVANSLLLLLIVARLASPTVALFAQSAKVLGSLLLFSANALALGWISDDTVPVVSGILDKDVLLRLYKSNPSVAFTFLAVVCAGTYSAAKSTNAPAIVG